MKDMQFNVLMTIGYKQIIDYHVNAQSGTSLWFFTSSEINGLLRDDSNQEIVYRYYAKPIVLYLFYYLEYYIHMCVL